MQLTDQDWDDAALAALALRVADALRHHQSRLATAESCTGGWIAKLLTDLPGSSAVFGYGYVSYADAAKHACLGVSLESLAVHGAVSAEVAEQMATGARLASGAEIAVAVSGIAGPDGGTEAKPVGTVWLAFAGPGVSLDSHCLQLAGSRDSIRRQSVAAALAGVLDRLDPA